MTDERQAIIEARRIPVKNYDQVEMSEDNPMWPITERTIKELDPARSDMIRTEFSLHECLDAPWIELRFFWQKDYPQPENDYLEIAYDLSAYCNKCGTGKKQKAPFRMLREPRWGTRHIFTFYWEPDIFFVRSEVHKAVFLPKGIGCIPVLHHSSGKELKSVVQLDIPTLDYDILALNKAHRTDSVERRIIGKCNNPVFDDDHQRETCPKCGRSKLCYVTRGPMPPMRSVPQGLHSFRTKEYFGANCGRVAVGAILISQELYSEIARCKLKGVQFLPVAAAGDIKWPWWPERNTPY